METEALQPIERVDGVTSAERYLKRLCERSFLSLWSYAGVFRDQEKKNSGDGKELCDLLVVFENHIIIFSDKDCDFPRTGDLQLDWRRWYRRAVLNSAKQLWGAERWINEHPDRLFLDHGCSNPFPIPLPHRSEAKFHRVVVAHRASERCKEHFGGSGSLMIRPGIIGDEHCTPDGANSNIFTIGQIDPSKGYVHVFDDTTLNIVMTTLDTISDLTAYLSKKEDFILSGKLGGAAGEEELLAIYLTNLNDHGNHDFILPEGADKYSAYIIEGFWEDFVKNPQRLAQIAANGISYSWDALIEKFAFHFYSGTSYTITHPNITDQERLFRLFARENRTRRRLLSDALTSLIQKTPLNKRGVRVMKPSILGEPYYIFLVLPHLSAVPYEEYRRVRFNLLQAYCHVVKVRFPDAEDILGIATETGYRPERSEDAAYLDVRDWSPEAQTEAERLSKDLNLLQNLEELRGTVKEYPDPPVAQSPETVAMGQLRRKKIGRNELCPCGSGKKYKRCCI